jgi:hypothetical protein
MQVVLTFKNTEVLAKIRRRDGSTLTRLGRLHEPVSLDELEVEDKEGGSQARPVVCIHLVLEACLHPFETTKHGLPVEGGGMVVSTKAT